MNYSFSKLDSNREERDRETPQEGDVGMWGEAELGIHGAHPLVFTLFHQVEKFNFLGFQPSVAECPHRSAPLGSSPLPPSPFGAPAGAPVLLLPSVQALLPARVEEIPPPSNLNPGSEVSLAVPRLPIGTCMPCPSKEPERQSGDYVA